MEYIVDNSICDFEFWGGAKEKAAMLTGEQMEILDNELENVLNDGLLTETQINNLFWFDFDTVCQILGYKDADYFMCDVSDNDIEKAEDWFEEVQVDADEMIRVADFDEMDFLDKDGEIDEDKVFEAFIDWKDGLSKIERVKVFKNNN